MADEQDIPGVDKLLEATPSDIRQDLANRARNDLFFFAKGVLGYKDMTVNCHGPLCVFLDRHPSRFKLVLMPRGHFKTTTATISRVMQKVTRNTNERILLVNETTTNAERFLSAIKQHAESNSVFRALFSEIIPKDTRKVRWSASELEFVRTWKGPEPTIDTAGMTGAMTSRHFTHITVDDPISEEATKSDAVMHDVITRIDKIISLMVKPEEDTFDLVGTRWAFHDVYSHFMRLYGDKMARFVRGAVEDGVPIFPELISLESLAQARANMGEYMFSCLYMNNPRNSELQDFNVNDLRFWRYSGDESHVVLYDPNNEIHDMVPLEQLDITVSVDLAPAEKATSDRNAIVTCGVTPKGDVVVLDVWAKRCTPLMVIERLFYLHNRFHPRKIGIEGVAYQKAFKYFLTDECERRGVYMNLMELKAVGRKEIRIKGLQPVAATGHLYIDASAHILRNEMAEFPLGEHDDTIDALSMQTQMWRGVMSAQRWERYRASEKALLDRIDGYSVRPQKTPVGSPYDGSALDPDDDTPWFNNPTYQTWEI